MLKKRVLITTTLIGALLAAPAFAGKGEEKSEEHTANYKEHMQQRQKMHMNMMQALADTMTILRDLNHQPSAEDKKRLTDMINQMNEMMAQHKSMGDKMGKHKDGGHKH